MLLQWSYTQLTWFGDLDWAHCHCGMHHWQQDTEYSSCFLSIQWWRYKFHFCFCLCIVIIEAANLRIVIVLLWFFFFFWWWCQWWFILLVIALDDTDDPLNWLTVGWNAFVMHLGFVPSYTKGQLYNSGKSMKNTVPSWHKINLHSCSSKLDCTNKFSRPKLSENSPFQVSNINHDERNNY